MMNKLTISTGKGLACLILLFLFLAQGCKKDILQPNSPLLKNSLSIAEAKQYFDANLGKDNKPEKLMTVDVAKSLVGSITLENKQPLWYHANQRMISLGGAVKIPLDFGEAEVIIDPSTKSVVPFNSLNYLLMYKDSLQRIHAEWVTLLPEAMWIKEQTGAYRGKIFVRDWHGKLIKSYS